MSEEIGPVASASAGSAPMIQIHPPTTLDKALIVIRILYHIAFIIGSFFLMFSLLFGGSIIHSLLG